MQKQPLLSQTNSVYTSVPWLNNNNNNNNNDNNHSTNNDFNDPNALTNKNSNELVYEPMSYSQTNSQSMKHDAAVGTDFAVSKETKCKNKELFNFEILTQSCLFLF